MNIIDNYPISEPCSLLAEMLHLITLFSSKIEHLKQKLSGFQDFSIQSAFTQIDTQNKGYLTIPNIINFLNLTVLPRDIQTLFLSHGNIQRLSFLGFLRVIKPYFNKKLAQEIALRGGKRKGLKDQYKGLVGEILGLQFVMIGELEKLKLKLAKEYCLNPGEIRRMVLGKRVVEDQGKDLMGFMRKYGYNVEEEEIRFLECYLGGKVELYDDHIMHVVFLPTHFQSNYAEGQSIEKIEKEVEQLPVVTKSNFLDSKYPVGKTTFVPLPLVSIAEQQPYHIKQGSNQQIKVLDGFLFHSNKSPRQNKSYAQIESPRQHLQQPSIHEQIRHPRNQKQTNTPFLDLFLKNSNKNFHSQGKKQFISNQSSQKKIEFSKISITPIKNNMRENDDDMFEGEYNNLNYHLSPSIAPGIPSNKNILDGFVRRTPKIKQQFQDSVSVESQSAFKYI